ncbi:MAG: endopeptidase La [Proteobacteria bacterium]|nr:endopeptidase La [Pseudomonadota bacterium]MCP4920711.1 endopeptidase La [Pseudomonadota bacterium]
MFFKDRRERNAKAVLPLLPLRDLVVFPHMVVPLIVGREKSIATLNAAKAGDKTLFLAAQREARTNNPAPGDIYEVGCIASIIQLLKLPDGTVKVLVEGKTRAQVVRYTESRDFFQVELEPLAEPEAESVETDALIRSVRQAFEQYVKLAQGIPPEMMLTVQQIDDPSKLADTLVAQLAFKLPEKQSLLEEADPKRRLERIYEHLQSEIEILQVEKKIKSRVKKQMEKSQKEYYLNEQMQAIQKELGEKDEFKNELQELESRIRDKHLTSEALSKLGKELRKLKLMSPMSAEANVVRTYVDVVLSLPWGEFTEDRLDIVQAARVLDEDHYGLRKIKERILEYLAVASLVERMNGPILCLVGPPGVGKTSLARSIARATNRHFVRMALGGVRDEAEIRGHRRTYIGAMPGKVVQAVRKAGSGNPVFLLDEIDKMSTDFRGDPSAALLEVLDPEQNETFNDHYLDLDYDLSKVMFICTANSLHGIPAPLQDRLEIIRLPGYTEQEKLSIARRYLIPKQLENHGITEENLVITQQAATQVVRRYTKEAGVRNLEREVAAICRKVAKRVVRKGKDTRVKVTSKNVEKLLGVPKFRYGKVSERDEIGFVQGLAWTNAGGVMVPIEAAAVRGNGKTTLTGQLGNVFQESSQAAITYIRSRSANLGLKPDFYQELDIHVHVPELWGVDGPSAGITIATAVVSAVTGIAVRRDIAMTGEITLRGKVRPIGGLKEKLLAAHRAGVRRVLVPKDNEPDLADIPRVVRDKLEILTVVHMDEVLAEALAITNPDDLFRQAPAAETSS